MFTSFERNRASDRFSAWGNFTKQVAYKMNLQEANELKCQVDELLEKRVSA